MPAHHRSPVNYFSGTVSAEDIDRSIRDGRRLRAEAMRNTLTKLRASFSRST